MEITAFQYFYPERPRLMAVDQPLFDRLSQDEDWVAEPKINGSRLQLHHLPDDTWEFWSRHGERLKFRPDGWLLEALYNMNLTGYWLFDGELRHNKTTGIRQKVCLYDVFIQRGELLLSWAFRSRRLLLESLVKDLYPNERAIRWDTGTDPVLTIARQIPFGFRHAFRRLIQMPEIEGLVLKNLNGKLNLGRKKAADSAWMWKVRRPTKNYRI